ncbi:MAG: hypothetical protein U0836_09230 [Pirellulales bacterium]
MTTTISAPSTARDLANAVVADQEARQNAAQAAYRDLVRQAADGAKIDPKAAAAILQDARKDAGDLQVDVARLLARRECVATMNARQAAEKESAAIGAKMFEARQKYHDTVAKAEAEHTAAYRELHQQELVQKNICEAANAARLRLQGELAPPELATRIEAVRKELEKRRSFYTLNMGDDAVGSLQHELNQLLAETLLVD